MEVGLVVFMELVFASESSDDRAKFMALGFF